MASTTDISGDITMRELLMQFPGAQRALFRKYHIGGCSSCGFGPDETLAQVCARNDGLPVEEVAAHIVESQAQDDRMQISPTDLAAALKSDPAAKLLDVRTREEFDAVHVEGAIFMTRDLMQEILGSWDRRALLAVMCHHGIRSMDAAAYFAGHGFENVKSVRGGIDAWSCEVDPELPRYELE